MKYVSKPIAVIINHDTIQKDEKNPFFHYKPSIKPTPPKAKTITHNSYTKYKVTPSEGDIGPIIDYFYPNSSMTSSSLPKYTTPENAGIDKKKIKKKKSLLCEIEDEESDKIVDELSSIIERQSMVTEELQCYFKIMKKICPVADTEINFRMVKIGKFPTGKASNKTLFLDLDETLVHTFCSDISYSFDSNNSLRIRKIQFNNPESEFIGRANVVLRPFVEDMLANICNQFEIVVGYSYRYLLPQRSSMLMQFFPF